MRNFLQGRYSPKFPEKYKGNPCQICYRSSWERKYMKYLDGNNSILEWSSEEIIIKYYDPISQKTRRYFPDFYVKEQYPDGTIKKYLVEIKPKKQTEPPAKPKRQTKRYISEVYEYAKNQSKWEAAKEWCLDRGYGFVILTEKELNIKP
jgi:hypothetical protein